MQAPVFALCPGFLFTSTQTDPEERYRGSSIGDRAAWTTEKEWRDFCGRYLVIQRLMDIVIGRDTLTAVSNLHQSDNSRRMTEQAYIQEDTILSTSE